MWFWLMFSADWWCHWSHLTAHSLFYVSFSFFHSFLYLFSTVFLPSFSHPFLLSFPSSFLLSLLHFIPSLGSCFLCLFLLPALFGFRLIPFILSLVSFITFSSSFHLISLSWFLIVSFFLPKCVLNDSFLSSPLLPPFLASSAVKPRLCSVQLSPVWLTTSTHFAFGR